jgi:hypothetical protein
MAAVQVNAKALKKYHLEDKVIRVETKGQKGT